MTDIPAFLDRRIPPNKETEMTPNPAAEPAKRTKRQSAYIANIKAVMPLADAASLVEAMRAVEAIQAGLPAGAIVTITADVGKI